jgi:hypothetical protein
MQRNVSLADLLVQFEDRIAHHARQEAMHAEQEVFHREQRAHHAAQRERLSGHWEALKAAAAVVFEVQAAPSPVAAAPVPMRARRLNLNAAVRRVIESKGLREPFGPRTIAAEVNAAFKDVLKRPMSERQASISLRFLAATGRIVRLAKGRPFHEAQYTRVEAAS